MDRLVLKLYITGLTSRSRRAVAALRQLCDGELSGHYELLIIDVLEQPELAERDKVLATPTVVKERPEPQRRIIGDLSDAARVLAALDLAPAPRPSPSPAAAAGPDARAPEAD